VRRNMGKKVSKETKILGFVAYLQEGPSELQKDNGTDRLTGRGTVE